MSIKQKCFILLEDEIFKYWYNIQVDMKIKFMLLLNFKIKEVLKLEDFYFIFVKEFCKQELNQIDVWIEIFEVVCEMYKYYCSILLVCVYGLEKVLGIFVYIYFKNESVSFIGFYKLNLVLVQVYYCKEEGVINVIIEIGVG